MNYLIESIFVGIYTYFIYLILFRFINNFEILLLVSGFIKHFLSSSLGLWTWYCNNGEACIKSNIYNKHNKYKSNTNNRVIDSIYESIAFLIIGSLLSLFIRNKGFLFFILGIILHIISELVGIHKYFCKINCDKTN